MESTRDKFLLNPIRQLRGNIGSLLSSFRKYYPLSITVPKNIYLRTKLICKYIEDKLEVEFDLDNFIMILYLEFLDTSIEKYDPAKIRQEITRSHGEDDSLIIHNRGKYYKTPKKNVQMYKICIEIDKRDAEKGLLLLEELEELYHDSPSLEKTIETLWINFVEDYKTGENNQALNHIIFLLKKHFYEDDDADI